MYRAGDVSHWRRVDMVNTIQSCYRSLIFLLYTTYISTSLSLKKEHTIRCLRAHEPTCLVRQRRPSHMTARPPPVQRSCSHIQVRRPPRPQTTHQTSPVSRRTPSTSGSRPGTYTVSARASATRRSSPKPCSTRSGTCYTSPRHARSKHPSSGFGSARCSR